MDPTEPNYDEAFQTPDYHHQGLSPNTAQTAVREDRGGDAGAMRRQLEGRDLQAEAVDGVQGHQEAVAVRAMAVAMTAATGSPGREPAVATGPQGGLQFPEGAVLFSTKGQMWRLMEWLQPGVRDQAGYANLDAALRCLFSGDEGVADGGRSAMDAVAVSLSIYFIAYARGVGLSTYVVAYAGGVGRSTYISDYSRGVGPSIYFFAYTKDFGQ